MITKHSHGDTGIGEKNRVLKQAKMVTIYHKTISGTHQKAPQQTNPPIAQIPTIYKNVSLTEHKIENYRSQIISLQRAHLTITCLLISKEL